MLWRTCIVCQWVSWLNMTPSDMSVCGSTPEQYSVDRRGLVQLWLLVAASCLAVATNACGFVGALLRIR